MPGVRVDGNDLLAVYEVARDAVERARTGGGPTLIESQTYRLFPHNTADDSTRYVPSEELEARRLEDPIPRMRNYLTEIGVLNVTLEEQMLATITEEITAGVAAAEAHPRPTAGQVFDYAYADFSPRLIRQRAEITGNIPEGDV
jgi:pyruvate dehydrogenase E1 component alpha subunit